MDPKVMRSRILDGNIYRTLLVLSGPIVFTQLVQVLYNLVDTFWLGRLGKAAVSAPAMSWPIVFTFTMFGSGFASAGLALASQYVGANKWEKVDKVVGNLLVLATLLSVAFSIFGFLFSPYILKAMGCPRDVFPLAGVYLKILFLALPFAFLSAIFSLVLRAVGDTMTPTKVNTGMLVLNAILDPLMIFGFGPIPSLGVEGAALATMISNALSALIGLIILHKGWKRIRVRWSDLALDWALVGKIFKIGLPAAIGNSLNGLAFTAIMAIVAGFGSVAVAAYGIGMRIMNIISGFALGISQAASIMVGQNIGAEQYARAKTILVSAIKLTFGTMAVLAIAIFILRNSLIAVFIQDPDVISVGSALITYFSLSVPFFGLFFPVMQSLRAAGKTKRSTALAMVRLWGMRVPFAYLFGRWFLSINGVWIGMALSNVLGGIISLYFLLKTDWIKKVI